MAGFAIELHNDVSIELLRPYRQNIQQVWRFKLITPPGAANFLIVVFEQAEAHSEGIFTSALPLQMLASGRLVSSGDAHTANAMRVSPQVLELYWQGRIHSLRFAEAERVALSQLWDEPHITLHRPMPRPKSPAQVSRTAQNGKAGARVSKTRADKPDEDRPAFEKVGAMLAQKDQSTQLGSILKRVFSPGQGRGKSGGQSDSPQSNDPPLLKQISGWLRWHSPLRPSLERLWSERADSVENLIRRGDVDLALKLAIKLGRSLQNQKPVGKRIYPDAPGIRMDLNFTVGADSHWASVLNPMTHQRLFQRYIELAAELEKQGDFLRAAFIRSQLLSNHVAGVDTLERGGLYREAAKLALDAGLAPQKLIRLHYLAGDLDAALALAKSFESFEALALLSQDRDPIFHPFVLAAWTDVLIDMKAPLAALRVTDAYAAKMSAHKRDEPFLQRRREWLAMAQAAAEPGADEAEIAVRRVLAISAQAENMSALASEILPTPETLSLMRKLAACESIEQHAFWTHHAPAVIEPLVRASFAFVNEHLGAEHRAAMEQLCGLAGLDVFKFDISKLKLTASESTKATHAWTLPPASTRFAPVKCACMLADGRAISWRASGHLQLWSASGKEIWATHLRGIVGLVAAGQSPNVILIQEGNSDDSKRLLRLNLPMRRIEPIADLDLHAWHDVTRDSHWLVQIAGETGALDLTKLLSDRPEISFAWSVQVTDAVRTVGFYQGAQVIKWITFDARRLTGPLLEMWTLGHTGKVTHSVLTPHLSRTDASFSKFSFQAAFTGTKSPPFAMRLDQKATPFGDWMWTEREIIALQASSADKAPLMSAQLWSHENARDAQRKLAARYVELDERLQLNGSDCFISDDFARAELAVRTLIDANGKASSSLKMTSATHVHTPATLTFGDADELAVLARGVARKIESGSTYLRAPPGPVLLGDKNGRLIRIDLMAGRMDIF